MNLSLFLLCLTLLSCLSLPQAQVDRLRAKAVSWIAPLARLKVAAFRPSASGVSLKMQSEQQELAALQLENHQLRSQLDLLYEWICSEKRMREQMEVWRSLGQEIKGAQKFLTRRSEEMKTLLQKQTMATSAKILYRDPSSWSSSCWIDVGEENNGALGTSVIAKNSPVVSGSSLVGVVEYVGKRQSRIRLITDSGLKTAVRAVRGSLIDRDIAMLVHTLIDRLHRHPQHQKELFCEQLQAYAAKLPIRWEDQYLAKGELLGSSASYFRALDTQLQGIGFNCDFPDEEGKERFFRDAMLQEGDLLVTSGLDGVFPPGLKVGIVTQIKPLAPTAFAYELQAKPTAGDLHDLSFVHVLPPVNIE